MDRFGAHTIASRRKVPVLAAKETDTSLKRTYSSFTRPEFRVKSLYRVENPRDEFSPELGGTLRFSHPIGPTDATRLDIAKIFQYGRDVHLTAARPGGRHVVRAVEESLEDSR